MWPQSDRRLLMQMHDIAHRANNVILHHSAASLSQGVIDTPSGGYTFNVEASGSGISAALGFGFWTFANTISLTASAEERPELEAVMGRHAHLVARVRSAGESAKALDS